MKKLSVLGIAFLAISFAICGCKKSATEQEVTPGEEKSFEQEQIEAAIKVQIDSLASELGKLKQLPFLQDGNGGLQLTQEEKQVKPDYLLDVAAVEKAATLAEKYRMLGAISVDKKLAALYEMPTEDYDKAIAKLTADINDPSFKVVEDANTLFETTSALYDAMNENGRINYFWQLATAALVEQMYAVNQNSDKFLSVFNDEAASDVTLRTVLILDAVERLAKYDPEIEPVAEALQPLKALNATTVEEMKAQVAEAKEGIAAARQALTK